jgi:hypothetical protein
MKLVGLGTWSVLPCTYRIRELNSAQELEGASYIHVIRTARSLYRCFLSCKDAFPTPDMKEELAKGVWNEACAREGALPGLSHQHKEAGLFSHMGHQLTRIFRLYVVA